MKRLMGFGLIPILFCILDILFPSAIRSYSEPQTKADAWAERIAALYGDSRLFQMNEVALAARLKPMVRLENPPGTASLIGRNRENGILDANINFFQRRAGVLAGLDELDLIVESKDPEGNPVFFRLKKALEKRLESQKWHEHDGSNTKNPGVDPNSGAHVWWRRGVTYPKFSIYMTEKDGGISINAKIWPSRASENSEDEDEPQPGSKPKKPH